MSNETAFPQPMLRDTAGGSVNFPGDYGPYCGMTLRDYFAAKAMQGLLANSDFTRQLADTADEMESWTDSEKAKYFASRLADHCLTVADAMLAAREAKGSVTA